MDSGLVATLAFGLLLGMEHALDADHVVAVSTIVSGSRSLLRSSFIGIVWGIGHTVTLLLIGLFVILFKVNLPPWVALSGEFLVGLVLIALGIQILGGIKRSASTPISIAMRIKCTSPSIPRRRRRLTPMDTGDPMSGNRCSSAWSTA